MELAVPQVVRRKAELAGAQRWIDDLPSLIAELERDWSITVGDPFDGGTEAYVARARRGDGTPAVLKLLVPRGDDAAHEITVLRLAGGAGCVTLLDADVTRGALLVERLGPSLADLRVPLAHRLEILCDLAARVWRPAPDCGLPTGAQKATTLAEFIVRTWHQLDRPCSERSVEHALRCAERRHAAHDDESARLLHGDVHQWNALQAASGFALVDPDGLLAEPEYDLGVLMREDPVDLLRHGPYRRAQWLAARTGCDPVAVWEWGVIERVSTGLVAASIGLQPVGAQMLHAAEIIAGDPDLTG